MAESTVEAAADESVRNPNLSAHDRETRVLVRDE
jgi:hypothetical protein